MLPADLTAEFHEAARAYIAVINQEDDIHPVDEVDNFEAFCDSITHYSDDHLLYEFTYTENIVCQADLDGVPPETLAPTIDIPVSIALYNSFLWTELEWRTNPSPPSCPCGNPRDLDDHLLCDYCRHARERDAHDLAELEGKLPPDPICTSDFDDIPF